MSAIQEIIARIEQCDADQADVDATRAQIDTDLASLYAADKDFTPAVLKSIIKEKAKVAKAQATLSALMGAGVAGAEKVTADD